MDYYIFSIYNYNIENKIKYFKIKRRNNE